MRAVSRGIGTLIVPRPIQTHQILLCPRTIEIIPRLPQRRLRSAPSAPEGRRGVATTAPARAKASIAETSVAASPPPLQLRSYQEECIQAVLEQVSQGERRLGVSLATGSGKTVIFTQLISRLSHPSRPTTATQTLILVHRKELVDQAAGHCRRQYPNAKVEIEMAAAHASGSADITVASIMSIVSGDRLEKFDPARFKLVLIDECHHAVSKGYLKCLEHFGLVNRGGEAASGEAPVLVGVSATMSRFDGLKLGKVLDRIVYHKDYMDMIADNWLSPCKFTTVQTKVDLSDVGDSSTGDFNIAELERAVNTGETNNVTIRSWLEKAHDRKSTIVFCVNIQHVTDIVDTFRKYGIDARPITSNTLLQVRRERLEEFRNGKFPVLVNCGVFTEGTDIPNIDCVLLARPTKSRNLLVQMIGRGMRLFPNKEDCYIIDMVGNLKRGIATVPTLFGLDPDELIEELSVEELQKLKERRELEAEKWRLERQKALLKAQEEEEEAEDREESVSGLKLEVQFTDYENVFDLLKDTKDSYAIRTLSQYSWVTISGGKHILALKSGNYLKIQRENDSTFTLIEFSKIPPEITGAKTFLSNKRVVMTGAKAIADIIQGADTLASQRQARKLLLHSAPWRKRPATNLQLKFLENFREKFAIPENLTVGQAGDIITKLRHGSLKEIDKQKKLEKREKVKDEREKIRHEKERLKIKMREEAKEQKLMEKYEKLRKLEEVKVGRLS